MGAFHEGNRHMRTLRTAARWWRRSSTTSGSAPAPPKRQSGTTWTLTAKPRPTPISGLKRSAQTILTEERGINKRIPPCHEIKRNDTRDGRGNRGNPAHLTYLPSPSTIRRSLLHTRCVEGRQPSAKTTLGSRHCREPTHKELTRPRHAGARSRVHVAQSAYPGQGQSDGMPRR